ERMRGLLAKKENRREPANAASLRLAVLRYFGAAFSAICATGVFSSVAISADSAWAFRPSTVQPETTRTTLPPLSIRILVGIVLASNFVHSSPLGSDSHRKSIFFLTT